MPRYLSVGEGVRVGDDELAHRDLRGGLCEEAEEIVLGEVAIGISCVRLEELGKDLVVAE